MRYSPLGYWGRQIAGVGLLALATAIVFWALPPNLPLLRYAVLTVASVVAVVVILSAYAKADEVILQTHKTAWFWGSMATLAAIPPFAIAMAWNLLPVPLLFPALNRPVDYFLQGMLFLLLLQSVAFLLLWAYYNLRRQG